MALITDYTLAIAKVFDAYLQGAETASLGSEVSGLIADQNLEYKLNGIGKIIGVVNSRVSQDMITTETAKADVERLYVECGFEQFLEYKYLKILINFYFDRKEIRINKQEARAEFIRQAYNANINCPVLEIKNGVNIMCLNIIVNCCLMLNCNDFSTELIAAVDALTEEERENAVFPSPLDVSF